MSKLEELIAELCPDGVEYKKISDFSSVLRGKRLTKNDLSEEGAFPVFHGGLEPLGFYKESNREANIVMIINVGASAGTVGFCDTEFWSSDGCYCVAHSETVIDRFLYFALMKQENYIKSRVRYAGIPTLDAKVVEAIKIPVPPLPVQEEIVRILDNFTELTTELTTELEARKKQYEYYRKKLLEQPMAEPSTKILPLKDIANVFRGEYITKKGTKEGRIPVILGGQEPAYYIDKSNHIGEVVVIARSGASAGFVSYWDEPIFITDGFGYEAKEGVTSPKYLYYILKNIEPELNAMKRGAGVPHVSGENLGKIELPVPPIAEQDRVVAILDRFDALCNDLSSGLPAEIEARKKQYEYYRDKLLTFKEIGQNGETNHSSPN